MKVGWISATLLVVGTLAVSATVRAACNDAEAPLVAPAAGIEMRLSPSSAERVTYRLPRITESRKVSLPEIVPEASLVHNRGFDRDGGQIIYLESDGKGGKRVCRVENWARRSVADAGASSPAGKELPPENPVLKKVFPYFYLDEVRAYSYDSAGRLGEVRLSRPMFHGGREESVRDFYRMNVAEACVRYDNAGRVIMVSGSPGAEVSLKPGFQCSDLSMEAVPSQVTAYTYYPDDRVEVMDIRKPDLTSAQKSGPLALPVGGDEHNGAWSGQGVVYLKDGGADQILREVHFDSNEKHGLVRLKSYSATIAPFDMSPVFSQRASRQGEVLRYTFPAEAVPLSAAGAQFSGIGGYTRVRSYQHRSGSEIYEIFAPGAKHPRERQWRTLDLNRQENYDANGKLTRVILSGPVSDGDGYTENLRVYAEKGVLKLTPLTSGYSSYRVYDYDAAGKETLSFVCWRYEVSTNKPYAHFPWWEPDPRPKRSREAELQYGRTQVGTRCGTPDGKMVVEGMGPVKKLMETKYGFGTTKLGFPGE
jgi:hypothetical protein